VVLKIVNLSKSFKGENVLCGVFFSVGNRELVSIIGPSGAGKTTLLKIIAGLENADDGNIYRKNDTPAILVFQDYLLFPSMTVYDNVAFGLNARHIDKKTVDELVRNILSNFGIEDKMRSYPAEISAGQKQRAAIARAMVLNPDILLLDEPFANLDKNLKLETADFIRQKQKEFKTAVLLVTHDQQEAFMISDKIGILIKGRLIQFDKVETVYNRPVSLEAASFLGHVNIIPERFISVLFHDGASPGAFTYARAESFLMEKDPDGPAVVSDIIFAGHYIIYRVLWEDWTCTVYSLEAGIRQGERVRLRLRS
jgi:putative spermidine/putrescine transport system ATP-binding protein